MNHSVLKQIQSKIYKYIGIDKVGLQWLPAVSGVEECKKAARMLKIPKTQTKIQGLECMVESCKEAEGSGIEGRTVCDRNPETATKGEGEGEDREASFPLSPFYSVQAVSLFVEATPIQNGSSVFSKHIQPHLALCRASQLGISFSS